MLADAAKLGDVEIPVFCYEPKLGAAGRRLPHVPGRDRGHPEAADRLLDRRSRTGWSSTPSTERAVKARSARWSSSCSSTTRSTARSATRAASARCRTSPSAGAAAISRFIEPKRHFEKPLELSPLIAIDRERCILCYRCVRFSQEIAEDYQLMLLERGAHSYVGTFDGAPLRRALQRQHHRAVPGRRADLAPLPLPRAAVGHRGRRLGLHALPGAVQRHADRARRARRCACSRARTHEVDDGWLCDKGRFAYQSFHADERVTAPLIRDGGELRDGRLGARARARRPRRCGAPAPPPRRSPAAARPTRRACCSARLLRDALGSPHLDSRPGGAAARSTPARALAATRRCRRRVADIEFAHAVLVLDREPRRRRADPRPAHPQGRAPQRRPRSPSRAERPSALDAERALSLRFAPGRGGDFAAALAARPARRGRPPRRRRRPSSRPGAPARLLRGGAAASAGEEVVIVYGERCSTGPRGPRRAALLALADALGLAGTTGAGLIEIPTPPTAAGCARRACCPNAGPGLGDAAARPDATRTAIAAALAAGELDALTCSTSTRCATCPTRAPWEPALERADDRDRARRVPDRGVREHADVVFPAEAQPRRTAPSRTPTAACSACVRRSPARARSVPSGRSWPSSRSRLGTDIDVLQRPRGLRGSCSRRSRSTPGLTLEEIGGRGVRWQEREARRAARRAVTLGPPRPRPERGGGLRSAPTARSGPRPRSRLARAALPHPPSASSSRPRTPRAWTAARSATGRRSPWAPWLRDAIRRPFLERGAAERRRCAARRSVESATIPCRRTGVESRELAKRRSTLRGRRYFEPWWIQIVKAILIFAVALRRSCRC